METNAGGGEKSSAGETIRGETSDSVAHGVLYAYCPEHLKVAGRKELWGFPSNIVFSKCRDDADGGQTMGFAVYEPDLSTFTQEKGEWSLTYWNRFGGNSYVIITLELPDFRYTGRKFVNGEPVGSAGGKIEMEDPEKGWALFFFQLGILGLSNGEQCAFRKVKAQQTNDSHGV